MPISDTTLESWAAQGSTKSSTETYKSVSDLLTPALRSAGANAEIYLQGSYRNDTNIKADSDVDIVVQTNDLFMHNIHSLSLAERQLFHSVHQGTARYSLEHLKEFVVNALQKQYGPQSVQVGKKALRLLPAAGRLKADILICAGYREYKQYKTAGSQPTATGVAFNSSDGRIIVNFPKAHYDNGVFKNNIFATQGRYKRAIRVFKNARTRLVDLNKISPDLAPSYFVESLFYNVPDIHFGSSLSQVYADCVKWLYSNSIESFVCRNRLRWLFGNTAEQWKVQNARAYIQALAELWNNNNA